MLPRRRASGWLLLAAAMLATGCRVLPRDPYRRAELALANNDLPAALQGFDQVPLVDPRYADARRQAAILESRLRRHEELLLTGLRLRHEWLDDAAITAFGGALEAWPDNEHTKALIRATEARRATLRTIAEAESVAPAPAPAAAPVAEPPPSPPSPMSPAGETAPPGDEPSAAAAVAPPAPRDVAELDEEVGARLARIEARLVVGDLDAVVADLLEVHRLHPDDPRVGIRLARLLQQRGLMRYGQGFVASAIGDWQRAIELDPSLRSARVLLELAAAEVAVATR